MLESEEFSNISEIFIVKQRQKIQKKRENDFDYSLEIHKENSGECVKLERKNNNIEQVLEAFCEII